MKIFNKLKLTALAVTAVFGMNTANAQCSINFNHTSANDPNITFVANFNNSINSGYSQISWDFGDGNSSSSTVSGASGSETTAHTYAANGVYYVCATINDSSLTAGCYKTYCDSIQITNAGGGSSTPCSINAGISFTDNGNGNYSFNSTSTGSPIIEGWSFGDGSNASGSNVNHTFAANGTYVVSLYAGDSSITCFDYATVTIVVSGVATPVACQAGFSIYTDSLFNGVYVVNSSTGSNLTYFWDFGDGNTSNLQYPNYTYSGNGPYSLCLTVTNGSCTSTYCDTIGSNGIVLKTAGFSINVTGTTTTSIESPELISNVNAYPNPVANNLTVELGLTQQANVNVTLTDLTGKVIANVANSTLNAGNNTINYNTSNVANGVYLLNVTTNNSTKISKIVVNK